MKIMTYLDIIIIIMVLYGGYNGFQKGIVSQFIISIIFFTLIYKGSFLFLFIKNLLNNIFFFEKIGKKEYLLIFFSLTIFLIIIILITLTLDKIIQFLLIFTWTKPLDRFLGLILGGIKYFIYISIFLFFLRKINKRLELIPDNLFESFFLKNFLFFLKGKLFKSLFLSIKKLINTYYKIIKFT